MMKQLDFFFDYFTKIAKNSRQNLLIRNQIEPQREQKTLVAGGKKAPVEVFWLHGKEVRVRRRPYQRHLSVSLKPNGVIWASAGRTIPLKMIIRFVQDSWAWVQAQNSRFEELRLRYPKKDFVPGEQFSILGVEHALKVRITAARRSAVTQEDGALVVDLPARLATSKEAALAQLPILTRSFYEDLGKKVLSERLLFYSQKLQLYPHSVSYRCQKTRWGSCSPSGHISLNWRLVAAPLEVIDYVVVHELCHLKHHNHSKSFWNLVETEAPRWKKIRKWLYENQYGFDFLSEISELHP